MNNLYYIPTRKKIISLTLDDGPTINTLDILDILKEYNIKATFFCLSESSKVFPHIIKKILDENHQIALHGFNHRSFRKFSDNKIPLIIQKGLDFYKNNFNLSSIKYFRSPFGTLTDSSKEFCRNNNLIDTGWSAMVEDWHTAWADCKAVKLFNMIKPGCILAMHDGLRTNYHTPTACKKILLYILPRLFSEGYSFVPLDELEKNYDSSITQKIEDKLLFNLYATINDSVLEIYPFWDMNTVKEGENFQLKIVHNEYESEIEIPFPSIYHMKQWFPTYEISLDTLESLGNTFSVPFDIYIKIKNVWTKCNYNLVSCEKET